MNNGYVAFGKFMFWAFVVAAICGALYGIYYLGSEKGSDDAMLQNDVATNKINFAHAAEIKVKTDEIYRLDAYRKTYHAVLKDCLVRKECRDTIGGGALKVGFTSESLVVGCDKTSGEAYKVSFPLTYTADGTVKEVGPPAYEKANAYNCNR